MGRSNKSSNHQGKDKYEFGLPLPNGYTVKVMEFSNKQYEYVFFDNEGHETDRLLHKKSPLDLTKKTSVGKKINEYCEPYLAPTSLQEEFNNILKGLNNFLTEYQEAEKRLAKAKKLKERQEIQNKIDDAMEWYSQVENPIIWLCSMLDWATAGERINIMISFLAACSQVILKEPISIVGEGLGSSGKNHVLETALELIPSDFVRNEKKPTLPSMFHRSKEDPHYYDGIIVYYGDMGGLNDQDEVMETKDILKELQTDGYVNRPIVVKNGDGFEVVDLELFGTPCLAYTTARDFTLDSQEASRSIEYKPRTDNKEIYDLMMNLLELKGKVYDEYKDICDYLIQTIPYVVLGLREKVSGVSFFEESKTDKEDNIIQVINPFPRVITQYIGDSQYYKRDKPKYNNLLKVIAVLNYFNHDIQDNKLFVTLDDIQLFITLFSEYRQSITHNLRQSEIDILEEIMSNWDKFCDSGGYGETLATNDEAIISINSYIANTQLKYGRSTIRKAFYSFEEKQFSKTVEGMNKRVHYYKFFVEDSKSPQPKKIIELYNLKVDEKDIELWEANYPSEIVDFLKKDVSTEGVNIQNQHKSIKPPIWRKKDSKYYKGVFV